MPHFKTQTFSSWNSWWLEFDFDSLIFDFAQIFLSTETSTEAQRRCYFDHWYRLDDYERSLKLWIQLQINFIPTKVTLNLQFNLSFEAQHSMSEYPFLHQIQSILHFYQLNPSFSASEYCTNRYHPNQHPGHWTKRTCLCSLQHSGTIFDDWILSILLLLGLNKSLISVELHQRSNQVKYWWYINLCYVT